MYKLFEILNIVERYQLFCLLILRLVLIQNFFFYLVLEVVQLYIEFIEIKYNYNYKGIDFRFLVFDILGFFSVLFFVVLYDILDVYIFCFLG